MLFENKAEIKSLKSEIERLNGKIQFLSGQIERQNQSENKAEIKSLKSEIERLNGKIQFLSGQIERQNQYVVEYIPELFRKLSYEIDVNRSLIEKAISIAKENQIQIGQIKNNQINILTRGSYGINDRSNNKIHQKEERIMGDKFEKVHNSTIINRSTVQNAFNRVQAEFDDETANALKRVEEEINKSGNKEAAENFEAFTEELAKSEPKKSLLKTLWQGTLNGLPTLAQLSGVVSLIMKLFS
ncbi:MAG: hypothetical protein RMY34_36125 [Aulosira sp. DedQUE10]|nr:hypothetical protein [Aulosira sp. DedQUE10]